MKHFVDLAVGVALCMTLAGCGAGSDGASTGAQRTDAAQPMPGTAWTPGQPGCWLDKLNGKPLTLVDGVVANLPSNRAFDIEGWLVDGSRHPADSMRLVLTPVSGGDAIDFSATTGVERVDVAHALGSDAATSSGFTVHGLPDQLAAGRYKATAQAKSGDTDVQCDFKVVFDFAKTE